MEAPLCNELTAPQTVIVKSQPAVNYAYLPQPLVARPYAGDTLVINAKPTVVYDSPKRIIYRKITCYSDDCNPTDFGGSVSSSSSSSSNNNRFTPTLNSGNNGQGGADISDDEDGSTAIGFGRRNTRQRGGGGGGRREVGFGRR